MDNTCLLRAHRAHMEDAIRMADRTLEDMHLYPYHADAVRRRRAAARLAAHYTAQIERIERCEYLTISPILPATRRPQNYAALILPAILRSVSTALLRWR